jgi:hypothetical protein
MTTIYMIVELAVADMLLSVHRRAHMSWISIVGRGEASLHWGRRARDDCPPRARERKREEG